MMKMMMTKKIVAASPDELVDPNFSLFCWIDDCGDCDCDLFYAGCYYLFSFSFSFRCDGHYYYYYYCCSFLIDYDFLVIMF